MRFKRIGIVGISVLAILSVSVPAFAARTRMRRLTELNFSESRDTLTLVYSDGRRDTFLGSHQFSVKVPSNTIIESVPDGFLIDVSVAETVITGRSKKFSSTGAKIYPGSKITVKSKYRELVDMTIWDMGAPDKTVITPSSGKSANPTPKNKPRKKGTNRVPIIMDMNGHAISEAKNSSSVPSPKFL